MEENEISGASTAINRPVQPVLIKRAEEMTPAIGTEYTEKFVRKYTERVGTSAIDQKTVFVDCLYYWLALRS